MRLTAKFVVALVVATAPVLGIDAWLRVQREAALFESDMRLDAALVADSVASAASLVWASADEAAARELVERADAEYSHVSIRWTALHPHLRGPLSDRGVVVEQLHQEGGAGALRTTAAIRGPGHRDAALEVIESLDAEARYLEGTVREALLWTAILVAAFALVAAALGWVFIARPTRLLVQHARRVGSGELEGRVELRQRDELGTLARELNLMSEQLAETRRVASAEAQARLQAVEQLRHADRLMTVGRLASGLAHELGTPLNVVAGRGELIAAGDVTGEEVQESARVIVEQSRRMTRIIRQLLDFARRTEPVRRSVELGPFATRSLAILETLARKASVRLVAEPGDTPIRVSGDESQLQQVLANLVVNALHATRAGGRITVSCGAGPATPPGDHGGPAGEWAWLRVSDTGDGMDEAVRARIFEPFFTTKDVGAGTGLGLSVAYGIVRDHGGWLDVESAPGQGSTFTVWLPLEAAAAAPASA